MANTAKYVKEQPIVAVNPDPARFDGILLPFLPSDAKKVIEKVVSGKALTITVTMAEAVFSDGQRIRAFNDLFIGPKSHISARYRLRFQDKSEMQSSSGVLVFTGAGSTGWLSSVFNMMDGVNSWRGGQAGGSLTMAWDDSRLVFVVREPFRSNHSSAEIVAGMIEPGKELVLESTMPYGGCVFSDGIESDFIDFNSGATAKIRAAAEGAVLVKK